MTQPQYAAWLSIRREEKLKYQEKYCEEHNLPYLVPRDGKCFKCGKYIQDNYTDWDMETTHITSCRECNTSFCE